MHTPRPSMARSRTIGRLAALLGLFALAGPAAASIPPEIPLVNRLGTGARALGMGGAYVAVAEDYTALAYNPAGLAQIRRVEFAGVVDHSSFDQTNTYWQRQETSPLTRSDLQSLGFAYPFATYRGSLVIGFAYDRAIPLNSDYYRAGSGGPVTLEEELMSEDGSVGAWRAGVAADVSPQLSLGAAAVLLSGHSRRERTFTYAGTNGVDSEYTYTVTDLDYTAVTGTIGALLRTAGGLRFGLALHLPETFTLQGTVSDDVHREQQITPDSTERLSDVGDFVIDEEIKLPFRVAAGLSYVPGGALKDLLLSFDLTYADWTQIDYNGLIRASDRSFAYRATTDLRAGAEYTFPTIPLRLRAGILSQPVAYRMIGTDVFMGNGEQAHFTNSRIYGSVGAGLLVEKSLTLDVAYLFGGYERTGGGGVEDGRQIGVTTEKVKDRRIYFGAAFRL
jgi:hypothetical protein